MPMWHGQGVDAHGLGMRHWYKITFYSGQSSLIIIFVVLCWTGSDVLDGSTPTSIGQHCVLDVASLASCMMIAFTFFF